MSVNCWSKVGQQHAKTKAMTATRTGTVTVSIMRDSIKILQTQDGGGWWRRFFLFKSYFDTIPSQSNADARQAKQSKC